MGRRHVNQLKEQEAVNEVFRAADKQLRPNRNGNLYLQVSLSDRTGSIGTRMWNASEKLYRLFENGDFVRVEGTTQLFQGAMQLIATRLVRIDPDEVDEDDFIPLAAVQVDKLVLRLGEMLRSMTTPQLVTLAECFLLDDQFMAKFTRSPAGIKLHHAHQGGLLEHVVNLMDVAYIQFQRSGALVFRGRFFCVCNVQVRINHYGAVLAEHVGNSLANAPCRAGYQRHLTV